jgi:SynChlorMet cassette protein ScmC
MIFPRRIQTRGGLLLHGALIEKDGEGIILAGPGGVGKSTAVRRIPFPWRPLCDDTTLVVCDSKGSYWAHPWPTWSNFLSGIEGGGCDVQHATALKSIFFLSQAEKDRVDPVDGTGRSACLLVESAEQSSWPMTTYCQSKEESTALRQERFVNICALASKTPCYHLRLSLEGSFWEAIESTFSRFRRNCA